VILPERNVKMRLQIVYILFIVIGAFQKEAKAQNVCINEILFIGQKDVRRSFILREIPLDVGDCLDTSELQNNIRLSQNRILNTGIFFEVDTELDWLSDHEVDIYFFLKEASHWSFAAAVDLPDRNFNVWWELKESLLDRLNFSLRTRYNNLSGKNDRLSLTTQVGYSQKLQLEYYSPYFDRKKKVGVILDALVSRQREINYATNLNQQQFHVEQNLFLFQRMRGTAGISYRPGLFWRHELMLEAHYNVIDPFVRGELNADFFLNGLRQRYDSWQYMLIYENRDMIPYPESGEFLSIGLRKEGLIRRKDLNTLYWKFNLRKYFKVHSKVSFEHILNGRLGLIQPPLLPYNNIRALGWEENFVRGYEFYLIDGLGFMNAKNSARYKLLDINPPLWNWIPFERYRSLPLKIYVGLNFDIGYVNNPYTFEGNNFSNRWLYGGGLGLDFVGYYQMVGRIEASVNHLGEFGVFLHYKIGIR